MTEHLPLCTHRVIAAHPIVNASTALTHEVFAELQVVEMPCEGLRQLAHILHIVFHSKEHSEGSMVCRVGPAGRGIPHQPTLSIQKDVITICTGRAVMMIMIPMNRQHSP